MTETRIGRYVLLEPVGRGAMGIVYRAEDPLILRTVAVKVLHATSAMTPQQIGIARERFRREAESAGSLDHPNVVRIFDVGEDYENSEMYLVMEYVSGPSVEKLLHEAGIDLHRAVDMIGQVASGLDAAHSRGLIHRDIKPSNILLTEKGVVKIVDFGITHVATSSLTQDMRELGTPAYMSPEQVNGKPLDPRADLFSLGVLSYEILSGRRPFEGTDAVSLAHAIAFAPALPMSVANPQLPRSMDSLMERILAKDPAERFATGREFHEALLACLSGGDIAQSSRRPSGSWTRGLGPWGLAGIATLAAVVLLVSFGADRSAAVAQQPPIRGSATQRHPVRTPAPIPKVKITVSLIHRLRRGTLMVSLDGTPILTEGFSKPRFTIQQRTTWEAVEAAAGQHKLRAKVTGDDGKTYLLDPCNVDLPRANGTELRIRIKGDALTVEEHSG